MIYINGNYVVSWRDTTVIKRALRHGEELIPDFPDSIDLKITNKCSWGCPYCHESSTPDGASFDFNKTTEILSQLPEVPIEIAIGGGNVLEAPKLVELIKWIKERGNQPRVTINFKDLLSSPKKVEKLFKDVGALGISLDSLPKLGKDFIGDESLKSTLWEKVMKSSRNPLFGEDPGIPCVIHIIAGIFPEGQLKKLVEVSEYPILILGYKQWGRAKDTELPKSLEKFKMTVHSILADLKRSDYCAFSRKTVGFDNLALEQLDIKSILTEKEWDNFYLGDEGTHSMYIDAVKGEYAMTSRSAKRRSWDSVGLIEYFKTLNNK